MKRWVIERTGTIGIIAIILFSSLSVGGLGAQTANPMMGQSMQWSGMTPTMHAVESWRRIPPRMSIRRMMHRWENYLIAEKESLGLKENQLDQIESILEGHRKYLIRTGADLKVLRMEIRELLVKEKIDLAGVESKVKALETLAANRVMEAVRTFEKILAVLTPEQQKEAKAFFKESLLRW
jgi:Spy/CpxP family protein refolding chaperone